MITFGYKNRFSGLIRALVALAVGIVMVVSKTDAMALAVRIIAAFLLASGIVSIIVGYRNRQNNQMPLMGVNGFVDMLIALLIFIFPEFVSGLIVYLIGFALLAFGIFQIVTLISANRVMSVGVMSFVMPVLVLLAGAFLVAQPSFIGKAVGVVAGVALIIYGLSELLSSWKMKQAMDEYGVNQTRSEEQTRGSLPDVKDVDFEKVEE